MATEARQLRGQGDFSLLSAFSWRRAGTAEQTNQTVEILEDENFSCERYKGSRELSEQVGDFIGAIYSASFTPRLANHYGPLNVDLFVSDDIRRIKDYLRREDTHVILLREKQDQQIVGFSYAMPHDFMPKTIELNLTTIREGFRDRGGWSLMMQALENGIASEKRKYNRMRVTATTENNFDEKFKKRYKRRIISEQDVFSSHGHHRIFTVHMGKNPLPRLLHR